MEIKINKEIRNYKETIFFGNILIVHCASGYNNVVITGKEGFISVARPNIFAEE